MAPDRPAAAHNRACGSSLRLRSGRTPRGPEVRSCEQHLCCPRRPRGAPSSETLLTTSKRTQPREKRPVVSDIFDATVLCVPCTHQSCCTQPPAAPRLRRLSTGATVGTGPCSSRPDSTILLLSKIIPNRIILLRIISETADVALMLLCHPHGPSWDGNTGAIK